MRIGPVNLSNPLVLAPMAGVTDLPFRRLCKELGAGLVCGEMISDQALLHGNRNTLPLLKIDPAERPVSLQLVGSRPETMGRAAALLCEDGPEIVDINFGCPVHKVVSHGGGAALLRDLPRAEAIVRAVVAASDRPVTVKMRAGWDTGRIVAPELAALCEAAGAAAVMVHARTREQFYAGEADWEIIRQVKQAVRIPVFGNGSIVRPDDARRMLAQTGCDGAAIGQGALGNPWLFAQSLRALAGEEWRAPTVAERFEVMRRHFQAALAWSGVERGLKEMRKHLAWYVRGLPGAAHFRAEVVTLAAPEAVLAALEEYERYLAGTNAT